MEIEIDYSPTDQLIAKALDPIQQPWLQPKRREITAFWKPADAERFATYLAQSLRARIFSENRPSEFTEVALADIEFYPELRHNLLFTNIDGITVARHRDPEKSSPFLRVNGPIHMRYSSENIRLLHYIRYSHEVVREGSLDKQPTLFLTFAREACDWLSRNYVSLRGKNTADKSGGIPRSEAAPPATPRLWRLEGLLPGLLRDKE